MSLENVTTVNRSDLTDKTTLDGTETVVLSGTQKTTTQAIADLAPSPSGSTGIIIDTDGAIAIDEEVVATRSYVESVRSGDNFGSDNAHYGSGFLVGKGNKNWGSNGFCFGMNNISEYRATALGYNNTVLLSADSLVIGNGNDTYLAPESLIAGYNNEVNDCSYTTVLGSYNHCDSSSYSFIAGKNNRVWHGNDHIIIGNDNQLDNNDQADKIMMLGWNNYALFGAEGQIMIGSNLETQSNENQIIIGHGVWQRANFDNQTIIGGDFFTVDSLNSYNNPAASGTVRNVGADENGTLVIMEN